MADSLIQINGMLFTAYHGCYQEEQIVGNEFRVQLQMTADTSQAELSDSIDDTANYQQAYEIVAQQMAIRSNILEHIARRIINAILAEIPRVNSVSVTIEKLNPPMGGRIHSVAVTLQEARNAQ